MELRKKNLHMMQKKSEAQNQITFDEDYNVPDQKADIGQIIQKKGEVEIEQVQVSEGKAVIQGQLIFRLLYVADNPGKQFPVWKESFRSKKHCIWIRYKAGTKFA